LRPRPYVRASIIADIAVRVKSESRAAEEENEALVVCGLEEPTSYTVEHN
jgi:hypothetical protein